MVNLFATPFFINLKWAHWFSFNAHVYTWRRFTLRELCFSLRMFPFFLINYLGLDPIGQINLITSPRMNIYFYSSRSKTDNVSWYHSQVSFSLWFFLLNDVRHPIMSLAVVNKVAGKMCASTAHFAREEKPRFCFISWAGSVGQET